MKSSALGRMVAACVLQRANNAGSPQLRRGLSENGPQPRALSASSIPKWRHQKHKLAILSNSS